LFLRLGVIGKGRQDVLTPLLATMKNDLSYHNLSMEDATKLALTGHSGGYWAASGAAH